MKFGRILCLSLAWISAGLIALASNQKTERELTRPLKIMPLGDSITRGTYLARYESGPRNGQAIGRPHPEGGGWRKTLQDLLRADGCSFDFVGSLSYHSFGRDGELDPGFDPDHHGLAGFGNRQIIDGGPVPTLPDTLDALKVSEVRVPDLPTVLKFYEPDVILLMSGTNGFNASTRDELITLIGDHSSAHLFVASILPQRPPRPDPRLTPLRFNSLQERAAWAEVDAYNSSLPSIVAAQQTAGHRVTLVEMHDAIAVETNLEPDGVHPNREGLRKMAKKWHEALRTAGYLIPAND